MKLIVGLRMAVPKAAIMLISSNHDKRTACELFSKRALCTESVYDRNAAADRGRSDRSGDLLGDTCDRFIFICFRLCVRPW